MLCEFFNEKLEYQENLLAKYYVKHNHDVVVITSTVDSVFDYYNDKHDINAPSREYYFEGAKIIKIQYKWIRFKNRLRKYKDITPILEAEQPDLIYIHDIMLNILEAVEYKRKHNNCKMIMDYHADYSNSAKSWLSLNILHKLIRKKLYFDPAKKYISKIFPIVPASFIFLHEVYDVPNSDMELLPLGANTDLGNQILNKKTGSIIRQKLDIPQNDFVIFTGGKLSETKKTDLLIKAFLKLNISKLHLIIVGKASETDINFEKELYKLAKNNKNIHFTGWLNNIQVYEHLDASDIAIFPASQSILWQQAISMRLPLIVGDTGNQSIAYLNEFNNIIILDKDDITESVISDKILLVMNDINLYQDMKLGAEKITNKWLNWDNLILKTLKFN